MASAQTIAPNGDVYDTHPYVREQYIAPVTLKIASGGTQYACSCLQYAKYITGRLNEFYGLAKYVPVTTQTPSVGAWVLLNEGPLGHTAVVTKIEGDNLYIVEANYSPCKIGTRVIPVDYPLIRGYNG